MSTHPIMLVTIVAEPVLEHRLTTEITALGATGFTVLDGRGAGSRGGDRGASAPGSNVRIESLVPEDVAEQIVAMIAREYLADHSIIAYVTPVSVVRTRKFAQRSQSAVVVGGGHALDDAE